MYKHGSSSPPKEQLSVLRMVSGCRAFLLRGTVRVSSLGSLPTIAWHASHWTSPGCNHKGQVNNHVSTAILNNCISVKGVPSLLLSCSCSTLQVYPKSKLVKEPWSMGHKPEPNTAKLSDSTRQSPDCNIYTRLIFLDPLPLLVACIADRHRELTRPVNLFRWRACPHWCVHWWGFCLGSTDTWQLWCWC